MDLSVAGMRVLWNVQTNEFIEKKKKKSRAERELRRLLLLLVAVVVGVIKPKRNVSQSHTIYTHISHEFTIVSRASTLCQMDVMWAETECTAPPAEDREQYNSFGAKTKQQQPHQKNYTLDENASIFFLSCR